MRSQRAWCARPSDQPADRHRPPIAFQPHRPEARDRAARAFARLFRRTGADRARFRAPRSRRRRCLYIVHERAGRPCHDHVERRARGGRKRQGSRALPAHARPCRLGRGAARRGNREERLADGRS
ncbi:putative Holliday junction resolvase YggF [Caballeronia sordidicola]|uniref:Putative Holliday junction resolvase YggF n=1 Tax=Caballeronia sordidicola TaxID=196367 RepID=A0A242N1Z3_CABSO|nr:putative Holliday junction resolvase YggF [Caballeronia sordidicola]